MAVDFRKYIAEGLRSLSLGPHTS